MVKCFAMLTRTLVQLTSCPPVLSGLFCPHTCACIRERQDEPWDPTLWEEFCASLGASSSDGLDFDQFVRFQAVMNQPVTEPHQPEQKPHAEAEIDSENQGEDEDQIASKLELDVDSEAEAEAELEVELEADVDPEPELDDSMAEARVAWCTATGSPSAGGLMSQDQMKTWALILAPKLGGNQQWDDALWPQLCASYGASPSDGFTWEQFSTLYNAHAEAHAATTRLRGTKALAEAYEVGAISKAQFEVCIKRLRQGALKTA